MAAGSPAYSDDADTYRRLMINHEMGHFLEYGRATWIDAARGTG